MRDDEPNAVPQADSEVDPDETGDGADRFRWIDDPSWHPAWPAYYARNAKGSWEAAHDRLLAKLRKEGQHYINKVLHKLRGELGNPHNGWDFKRSKGPGQVVLDAETELKLLADRLQHNRAASRQIKAPSAKDPASRHDLRKPRPQDWWSLAAILAGCIALEAIMNSYLLASALTTGLVGAFVTAIGVSLLNVGALGAGVGLLLAALRRRAVHSAVLYGCFAVWGILALLLNLLVGRHREAFAQIIDAREQAVSATVETDMAAVTETAATIPYAPSAWQFESLLFFGLGLALCGVGLYKGFTFIKSRDPDREKRALEKERATILEEYRSLPTRFRGRLTNDLRNDVAGWVQQLSVELQHASDRLEDLEHNWARDVHLSHVEALFVRGYNDTHATKIDGKMLQRRREEEQVDLALPVARADKRVLDETSEIIGAWSDGHKETFFTQIDDSCREIEALWTDYRPLIAQLPAREAS